MTAPPPLPPTFRGLYSPPPSPRKRRREQRESDETHGPMSLEEYLLRSDVFRSTTRANPLPYPLVTSDPPQELKDRMKDIEDDIANIIRNKGFTECQVEFVNVSKPGYPGGDRPTPTLKIESLDTNMESFFGPLKDDIRDLLFQKGLHTAISIDISNPDKCYDPHIFAIEPTHRAIPIYREIRPEALKMLDEHIRDGWQSMCLFYVGSYLEKSSPAIVVHVTPGTTCDWSRLEARVITLLGQVGLEDINLDVEFIPGTCREVASGGLSLHDRMDKDFLPKMGGSIGVKGEEGGGSLGIFATLKVGDTEHKGFLTNHHVVRCTTNDTTPEEKVYADRHGFQYEQLGQPKSSIQYLAGNDVEATRKDLEETLKAYGHLKDAALYKDIIKDWEAKLEKVNALPEVFGEVLVSSGKTIEDNHISDWAFVKILSGKDQIFCSNIIPPAPDWQTPKDYDLAPEQLLRVGKPVAALGTIVPGKWYYKCGRTTNITAGICNGVESSAKWRGADTTRYDANGVKIKDDDSHTEEFVIVSMRKGKQKYQFSFSEVGDSGSAILDSYGQLCGLLFGQISQYESPTQESYTHVGLVSCMSRIRPSIERRTRPRGNPGGVGGELVLPV
ncbi:hypothetical protein FQN52_005658 [Onygenales sp. PD_12]|nr:hypothetical protein FQN53_001110 [Emmonsiellopsis sp. PD_33]KAK2790390.1 hypothetical protein FQN52_005658 [Onygenales sp. PD_12]